MRPCSRFTTSIAVGSEIAFHPLVRDEEQRGAGGGPHDRGADAIVYSAETPGGAEAGGGLQAGFERVEGEEGEVYCCAG